MTVALAGNQNCGKTTLFNQLTGSNQHVGNFPGITVEQKTGAVRGEQDLQIVDLPGVYSLRPYSGDELVTRDFLLSGPDGILNIVDATNPERGLYLTLQLLELNIPTVLALNMMDELRENGGDADAALLSRELGIPVVPVSAAKREGLDALTEQVRRTVGRREPPLRTDFCAGPLRQCIRLVEQLVGARCAALRMPPRFCATKLVEDDAPVRQALGLGGGALSIIADCVADMERALGTDRYAALADMRYTFIEKLCARAFKRPGESAGQARSARIDAVLTDKYLGIPIFLGIMLLVFTLTFGPVGGGLSDLLAAAIGALTGAVARTLQAHAVNPVVQSLVLDGIFTGVGSVLGFLPIILTLFFFLSILEDSGYMARVAFLTDRLLHGIGLSGRSIVPMLLGFGCTVPAVLAARMIPSERDRRMTILLTPFMSCSAKLPIYAVFTAAFFQRFQPLVMLLLYAGGVAAGILCGFILRRTVYPGQSAPFVLELPNYRLPSARSVWRLMWDKARDFVARAFTVILTASLLVWLLQTFNYRFDAVQDSARSMLGTLGMAVAPMLAPLGLRDWRVATALLTGLSAKEAVISTLAVLADTSAEQLGAALTGMFTPLSALSFLTFTLLYTPCVAAIAAIARELSARSAVCVVLLQCAVAWLAAALVYQAGTLLGFQ